MILTLWVISLYFVVLYFNYKIYQNKTFKTGKYFIMATILLFNPAQPLFILLDIIADKYNRAYEKEIKEAKAIKESKKIEKETIKKIKKSEKSGSKTSFNVLDPESLKKLEEHVKADIVNISKETKRVLDIIGAPKIEMDHNHTDHLKFD